MQAGDRPNIVIINPDEMRADAMSHLGCRAIQTRHLDALARDGISFEGAFCQNPVCVPSRCSFLTGWYPHVAGHRTMASMLGPDEPLMFRYLKQNGYFVWVGPRNDYLPAQTAGYHDDSADVWFLNEEMEEVLLDEKLEELRRKVSGKSESFLRGKVPQKRGLDDIWVDGACEFLESYEKQKNGNKPFCLFLPLQHPHPPYEATEEYLRRVDRTKLKPRILPPKGYAGKCRMMKALHQRLDMENWDDEAFEEVRTVYLAMCLKVDDYIGRIVETLKQQGLYENTAIFVLSDHGDYTGDYNMVEKQQNSFEDCLVRVPFLIKLPEGMQARHGVMPGLVELVDFYATIEALAGYTPGHTHFGHSLLPFLKGEEGFESLREAVFCEGGFREGEMQCFYSERKPPFNPGHRYYPRLSLQAEQEPVMNGKAIMCRTRSYKYVKRLYEPDELYDLEKDPDEICNVAGDSAYKEILYEMQIKLLTHYLDTCDVVPFRRDARQEPQVLSRIKSRMNI